MVVILLYSLGLLGVNLTSWPVMALQTIAVCAIFAGSAFVVILKQKQSIKEILRLNRAEPWIIIISAFLVIPLGICVDEVTWLLYSYKPELFNPDSVNEIIRTLNSLSLPLFAVLTIILSAAPAICEEIMFRGLVYRSFRADMPVFFAIIYSSVLFGLAHFGWLQGISAGLLGTYLAFTVFSTKSIYSSMAAHFVNNFTWCIFIRLDDKGLGSAYLKGHDAGTVVFSAILSAAGFAILYYYRKKYFLIKR
jgi:membrane protease YdiL (CAAX protease family)